MELYRVRDLTDPLVSVIKDDPVRPHIPIERRITETSEILILRDAGKVLAVTCMAWLGDVPSTEQDLEDLPHVEQIAVFYTIWSYSPGAGAELLRRASQWLLNDYQNRVRAIVTLSPQTDMARKFHLKNGAKIRRENPTSVNYEYWSKPVEPA